MMKLSLFNRWQTGGESMTRSKQPAPTRQPRVPQLTLL